MFMIKNIYWIDIAKIPQNLSKILYLINNGLTFFKKKCLIRVFLAFKRDQFFTAFSSGDNNLVIHFKKKLRVTS